MIRQKCSLFSKDLYVNSSEWAVKLMLIDVVIVSIITYETIIQILKK